MREETLVVLAILAVVGASSCRSGASVATDVPENRASPSPEQNVGFQESLLANGLTFAEYEQAFLAFADCAKQAGWSFESEPVLTARQNYDFRMVLPGANGPGLDQLSLNALEDCRVAYFDSVQQQWAMQTQMSEQERQQARDWLGSCMRERGVDVPTHPSGSDWTPFIVVSSGMSIENRSAFNDCSRAAALKFGLLAGEVP